MNLLLDASRRLLLYQKEKKLRWYHGVLLHPFGSPFFIGGDYE